ncbi:MAG: phospho-N-acetylmuramoyl-pentapeptide-transferase, partial [Chlorobiales bacterium]|nr:phospho-N-acetylmuramoyl-pentapeptide-transferase [Chlorobiales bacterium]
MLYYLLKYLHETYEISGLRVINYITFRAGAAAVTALVITLIFGPKIIRFLRERVIEPIKEEAPEEHRKKVNVPTMGGLIIILAIEVSGLLWAKLADPFVWLVLVAILWM